ncbi:hypothetical protein I7I51_00639 [Histoplasma capsulatum]|uniref:Uncharacterized protein n=1 Tax=Ajellomyces capsulatus TaxID=5037 RepID=A0A8A1MCA2_AJECA|nr:predicted protein [Histoplasma mississippiense (nom. inval.)]EDN08982.1 predicted protein [Histoplasma mississippiense (nom. inval.)]QSS63581.1 hypothetical protein I7I51_00639 [Histoplasma capsulatum]
MFWIPFPLCFQCGTDQNPCRCKVVGPTLGFLTTVLSAIVLWPASIFCGCWATKRGSKLLGTPVEWNGKVNEAIPI